MFTFFFNMNNYFFSFKEKNKWSNCKKTDKNLTELKVNGPILSMPVSCAIKVVPQMKVQLTKQIKDIVFFISCILYR